MTTSRPGRGVALVLCSGVLFAVNGTVAKLVLRAGLGAPQLTALRAAGAFLVLALVCAVLRPGPRRLVVTRREVPLLVLFGLCGFCAVPMLYFVAISRLPVGIALLFEYTAPLLVALWARFGRRRPVRRRLWAGLALSLLGLAAVAQVGGDLRLDPLGVAAGLGAAVLLAAYYVLGGYGVARRDALSVTTWAFGAAAAAGLLVLAVLAPAGGAGGDWRALGRDAGGVPVVLLCASVVLLGSVVPYLLVSAALRHLPATSVGIVGMVEPVLAAAVAWVALGAGEALTGSQLAGGALVLAGVVLAETARTAADTPVVTGPQGPVAAARPGG